MIRKACIDDVKKIHSLINISSSNSEMLARPLGELYDNLRDYFVYEETGEIIGTGALHICWEDLAEIRSLAVLEDQQANKVATRLVEACLREARSFGIKRVFALTYVDGFFENMGFKTVEKSQLPHKVWSDCLKCPKFPECDETAMVLDL